MFKKFISFLGLENPWGSWEVFDIHKDSLGRFFSIEVKNKRNSGEFKFRKRLLASKPLKMSEEGFKNMLYELSKES